MVESVVRTSCCGAQSILKQFREKCVDVKHFYKQFYSNCFDVKQLENNCIKLVLAKTIETN